MDGKFVEAEEEERRPWTWADARWLAAVLAFIVVGGYVMNFTSFGQWLQCHQSIAQWLGFDPSLASCN